MTDLTGPKPSIVSPDEVLAEVAVCFGLPSRCIKFLSISLDTFLCKLEDDMFLWTYISTGDKVEEKH